VMARLVLTFCQATTSKLLAVLLAFGTNCN
jgi:hypothetical protein